jgi:hypothetical protein
VAQKSGVDDVGAIQAGSFEVTLADANTTLTQAQYENRRIKFSGTLTAGRDVILPNNDGQDWWVHNNTAQTLTFKVSGGTGIAVATTKKAVLMCNGTDIERWTADL